MNKVFPFLLLFTGVFAIVGVMFLIMRSESLPAKVRSFDWRNAINSTLDEPAVEEAVEEVA